jgi:hypothetical protein
MPANGGGRFAPHSERELAFATTIAQLADSATDVAAHLQAAFHDKRA